MRFPHGLSEADFLSRHWQKRLLFIPDGIPASLPRLDADELAWLATLDEVESRLIFTERTEPSTSYRVEHGPFDEKTLSALPDHDWTLLVNDVEKHLPELRDWLLQADFIPDWRIDDLMVSFASTGGSVGPHSDNYDVFLCQGSGERHWRVSTDAMPAHAEGDLLLLQPFVAEREYRATRSDILYLPPGVAHWGTASTPCVTYSIGMRAPTIAELLGEIATPAQAPMTETASEQDEDCFYSDADLGQDESEPGCISCAAVTRVIQQIGARCALSDDEAATVLGCVATRPKSWLHPEEPQENEIQELIRERPADAGLRLHGMARLAWFEGDDQALVFVNGRSRRCHSLLLATFKIVAAARMIEAATIDAFNATSEGREFLAWMLRQGSADLGDPA